MIGCMSGPAREAGHGPETILLVDDDESVRAVIRESLEQNGYIALEASFNSEALLIARRHEGPLHLRVSA